MSRPETLQSLIDSARGSVGLAHSINSASMARNAATYLRTAQSYVQDTPEIAGAFEEALSRVQEFGEECIDASGLPIRPNDAMENARQIALLSIGALAEALHGASPSWLARDLGLDWF